MAHNGNNNPELFRNQVSWTYSTNEYKGVTIYKPVWKYFVQSIQPLVYKVKGLKPNCGDVNAFIKFAAKLWNATKLGDFKRIGLLNLSSLHSHAWDMYSSIKMVRLFHKSKRTIYNLLDQTTCHTLFLFPVQKSVWKWICT